MMSIPAYVIRGGSSRGVIARYSDMPDCLSADQVALQLLGAAAVQIDGLGGGGPTTSKFVGIGAIERQSSKLTVEYRVANLAPGSEIVDWEGTCGNMTSAVPLFAVSEGLYQPHEDFELELVNLSTGGRVEIRDLQAKDDGSYDMVTRYLAPEGAVLGKLLPTGSVRDHSEIDGQNVEWSLLDVTHPYLFVSRAALVSHDGALTAQDMERIEALRGDVACRIGCVDAAQDAAVHSSAVPRVILIEGGEMASELRVTAISMGKEIASVPVTSALCIAAAAGVKGSVVANALQGHRPDCAVLVKSGNFSVAATAAFDADGRLVSASVPRNARVLMQGNAFLPMSR